MDLCGSVLRAWDVRQKIDIAHLAPTTYDGGKGQHIATRGALLTPVEAKKIFQLEVSPRQVFGQPAPEGMAPMILEKVFRPSKGFPISFGERQGQTKDGEHYLYILKALGDVAAVLGRMPDTMSGKVMIKVGLSKDPNKRCIAHNKAIPPASVFRWKLELASQPYASGESAKLAEDKLKSSLAASAESLGGEFFVGREADMLSVFYGIPGVARSSL